MLICLFLVGLSGDILILVPLFNVHLDVSVGAVSDGLDHRLDLSVEFLAVFAPKVGLRSVNDEFHVFAARLENRVLWENAQILFL